MKKRKILLFFLLSFISWFIAFVLSYNNFTIKGKGPLSWQEIYDDLHKFLVMSLFGAISFTFCYIVKKYDNKEGK